MGGGASKRRADASDLRKEELLKQTPFFTLLADEGAVRDLARYFKLEVIKEGELVRNGCFIIVVEGELALSTLVPNDKTLGKNAGHVSELLAVKKSGDFFSKAGKEVTGSVGYDRFKRAAERYHGSAEKVVRAFDFTTVRAMCETKILVLEPQAKERYLDNHMTEAGSVEKVLNTDIKRMLKPIPFLKGVSKNRLSSLAELFTYESYTAGEVVIAEGAVDDSFYLVLQGKLKVTAALQHDKAKPPLTRSVTRIVESSAKAKSGTGFVSIMSASAKQPQKDASNDASADATAASGEAGEEEGAADDGAAKGASDTAKDGSGDPEACAAGKGDAKEAGDASQEGEAAKASTEPPTLDTASQPNGQRVSRVSLGPGSLGSKPRAVPVMKPQPSLRLLRMSNSHPSDMDVLELATFQGGSYFGEIGMMVDMPRSATIVAEERCLLAKMKGAEFQNFLKLSPDVQALIDEDARARMVKKLYAFQLPFFAGMAEEELQYLAHLCTIEQHPPDTELMHEGGTCNTFFIVIHGLVNVVKQGETVVRLAQGAYFGEISLISGKPHLATVVSHTPVVLLAISRQAFDEFFKDNEQLLAEFEMRVLGEREMSLRHVLRHSLGRELFRQHLINEYTPEHLMFWEAVDQYRLGTITAEEIITKFIGKDAETPINVEDNMAQRALDAAESPTRFDECREETYQLMKRDNFERFKKSPLFKELMDAIHCYSAEDLNIDEANLRRLEISFGRVRSKRGTDVVARRPKLNFGVVSSRISSMKLDTA